MTRTLSRAQVLAVQDYAARTGDRALLRQSYAALGFDSGVAFLPATPDQVELGIAACARAKLPSFTIECDDGEGVLLYWCTDGDWDQRGVNVRRFLTREDAELALPAAKGQLDERRWGYVAVEECV